MSQPKYIVRGEPGAWRCFFLLGDSVKAELAPSPDMLSDALAEIAVDAIARGVRKHFTIEVRDTP